MEQTQKILVYDNLVGLDQREQSIIKLYYWAGFTDGEIANSYLISQPMIHKIRKRAINKLRGMMNGKDSIEAVFEN